MNYLILNNENEIKGKLRETLSPATKDLLCYFSSNLNAYLTDPLYMNVPIEDKITHKGYSVFDAIKIFGNKIYQIDKHLDRFEKSINYINLKSKYTHEEYKKILIKLSSIARSIETNLNQDIELRIYYSAGLGNFAINTEDEKHTFYAIALKAYNEKRPVNGTNEYTVDIDKLKASARKANNTNYLINSITAKISNSKEGFLGIMLDNKGNIIESSEGKCGILKKNGIFYLAPFDITADCINALNCLKFIEDNLIKEKGKIKEIIREYVNINDIEEFEEFVLFSGGNIIPVLSINGKKISNEPGDISKNLQKFLDEDKEISGTNIPKF